MSNSLVTLLEAAEAVSSSFWLICEPEFSAWIIAFWRLFVAPGFALEIMITRGEVHGPGYPAFSTKLRPAPWG